MSIKLHKVSDMTIYIFCLYPELEKNIPHIQTFKETIKGKFNIITERKNLDLVQVYFNDIGENVHSMTKDIYFHLMAISTIGIAIIELCSRRPSFFESLQKLVDMNLLQLPDEMKEIPKTFLELPLEPLFRVLSRNMITHIDIVRLGLINFKDPKLDEWCNNLKFILCRLVEKCCGKLIIKMLEEEREKIRKFGNNKDMIKRINNEISMLEKNFAKTTETRIELQELFFTNTKLVCDYVYVIFIMNVFKLYKQTDNFLILVDSDEYAMFLGILGEELKKKKTMIHVKVFGNVYKTEDNKFMDRLMQSTLSTAEEMSMEKANELLEEENKEKQEKLEKKKLERERLEKKRKRMEERLKQEAEERLIRENEERLKQEAEERLKQEAEERLIRENEERLKQETEERLIRENEERLIRENEERLIRENEERLKQEAEERLKQEAEERLKQEAEERLKQETEERLKQETEERLKQELLETKKVPLLKLNPTIEEFIPTSKKSEINTTPQGVYMSQENYNQMMEQFKIFKAFPSYYFTNQKVLLFEMLEKSPSVFKFNEIQAYTLTKTHLFSIWNTLYSTYDYKYRDILYTQFRNLENQIVYIANM
jgi:hypothetical protein